MIFLLLVSFLLVIFVFHFETVTMSTYTNALSCMLEFLHAHHGLQKLVNHSSVQSGSTLNATVSQSWHTVKIPKTSLRIHSNSIVQPLDFLSFLWWVPLQVQSLTGHLQILQNDSVSSEFEFSKFSHRNLYSYFSLLNIFAVT